MILTLQTLRLPESCRVALTSSRRILVYSVTPYCVLQQDYIVTVVKWWNGRVCGGVKAFCARFCVCWRVTLFAIFWICVLEVSSSCICWTYYKRWAFVTVSYTEYWDAADPAQHHVNPGHACWTFRGFRNLTRQVTQMKLELFDCEVSCKIYSVCLY